MASYFIITLEIVDSRKNLVYRFLPARQAQNVTSQLLAKIQNKEMAELEIRSKQAFYNNFIRLADADGIALFEETYQIIPDLVTESLEFRRNRVLNRRIMTPPFTRLFVEQKLESVFGPGKYALDIDYGTYYVGIDVETDIPLLYEETMAEMRKIIPANMVLETAMLIPYTYLYLNATFTYEDLEQYTYEELSQYSE
jgi:hypothetical protein